GGRPAGARRAARTRAPSTGGSWAQRPPGRNGSRRSGRYRLFGNPDDAFAQSQPKRGLITQAEVRSIALAQLDIRPTSVVWDIGAVSGSVAIEAVQLAYQRAGYAIYPNPNNVPLLQPRSYT